MAFEYTKQPSEKEIIAVDFSRRVPLGVTVTPVAVGVTDVALEATLPSESNVYGPHITIGTPVLTGVAGKEKVLAVMVSDGVTGYKYRLSFRITLSDGQKKEDDVWITVKET
jgi:hypothetical protein